PGRSESALGDHECPGARVNGCTDAERDRAQVVPVSQRQVVDDRYPERQKVVLEDVLHRTAAKPRLRLAPLLALVHLSDPDPGEAVELSRVPEVGQHPVDVPGRAVDILEEEDRSVELELPGRRERFAQKPEAATDEWSRNPAGTQAADVRVVGTRRDLAQGLR